MSDSSDILAVTHARPTRTLRFARFVVRNRFWFALGLVLTTLFFFYPILNAILTGYGVPLPGPAVSVDTSARAQWPDHPFIHAQDKFAKKFGTSSLAAIGVVVREGNIFTPETLKKIHEITRRLDGVGYDSHNEEREALRDELQEKGNYSDERILKELDKKYPPYPVNHDQVRSLAHSSTRAVQIEPDGSITSDILMKKVPENMEAAEKLRGVVLQNPPFIYGRLVSWDEKGALITRRLRHRPAQLLRRSTRPSSTTSRRSRTSSRTRPARPASRRANFGRIFGSLARLVRTASSEPILPEGCNFQVYVTGEPIHVGWIIKHAFEIGVFVGLTVLVVFALLLGYFRRRHGVLIPFIAAIATAIWGAGFCGWMGIIFDPLVLVIPMIITARAVSHTVQMAERFFEDYEILMPQVGDPEVAKIEAATIAMAELIVPGTLGIVTDVAGLAVISLTTIPQMYELGDLRRVLGARDPRDGRAPAPDHDLLPAGARGARALPAEVDDPLHHLHRLGRRRTRAGSTWSAASRSRSSSWSLLHHALRLEDRPGDAGHAAALAGPRVQRGDRRDRQTLRRRRLVRGLHQRRQGERQRRPAADPAHDRVRALDAELHRPGRVGLDRADHPRLLADEPLRRPEVAVRPGASRHGAHRDLPAAHERRAGLPAARS